MTLSGNAATVVILLMYLSCDRNNKHVLQQSYFQVACGPKTQLEIARKYFDLPLTIVGWCLSKAKILNAISTTKSTSKLLCSELGLPQSVLSTDKAYEGRMWCPRASNSLRAMCSHSDHRHSGMRNTLRCRDDNVSKSEISSVWFRY